VPGTRFPKKNDQAGHRRIAVNPVTTIAKTALSIAETSIKFFGESATLARIALESTYAEWEPLTSAATQTDEAASSPSEPPFVSTQYPYARDFAGFGRSDDGDHPIRDMRELIENIRGDGECELHDALDKILAARGHEECMTSISNLQLIIRDLRLQNVELEHVIQGLRKQLSILNSAYRRGAEERTTLEYELFELREGCD
jgi:hypothetical protein